MKFLPTLASLLMISITGLSQTNIPETFNTTPPVLKADGKPYSDQALRVLGDSGWQSTDTVERAPTQPGQSFVPLPSDATRNARKTLTAASNLTWKKPEDVITSHIDVAGRRAKSKIWILEEGEDYVIAQCNHKTAVGKFPKDAFVEYGGTDKGEIVVEAWNWPPVIASEKRIPDPGLADDPQGYTPKLFAKLKEILPENSMSAYADGIDWIGTHDLPILGTIPIFTVLEQFLAEQATATDPINAGLPTEVSLRPEFEKLGLSVHGSKELYNRRPDLSCGPTTLQSALELLWSRKEGRTVKLSAAYIRWAHDQVRKVPDPHATSPVTLVEAIRRYGVCEETLMPDTQKTPSPAAIADAAKRTTLVTRQMSVLIRMQSPNQPSNLDRTVLVIPLVISELHKGHPIFAEGALMLPGDLTNPLIIRSANGVNGKPQNARSGGGHMRIITGLKTVDWYPGGMGWNKTKTNWKDKPNFGYLLEARESSGTGMGDKGYVYSLPFEDEDRAQFVSLGLE